MIEKYLTFDESWFPQEMLDIYMMDMRDVSGKDNEARKNRVIRNLESVKEWLRG